MNHPEQFIADYLDGTLSDQRIAEFNAWLKADAANMARFTEEVMFEHEIRIASHAVWGDESVTALAISKISEGGESRVAKLPGSEFQRTRWLAKAAAWIGAFGFSGNTANASTFAKTALTAIMTKNTTAAIATTAAILLAGGGAVVLVHQSNQKASVRVAELEAEVESMRAAPSVRRPSEPARPPEPSDATPHELLTEWSALFGGGGGTRAAYKKYRDKLSSLDAQALKGLLLEAEQMGNVPSQLITAILIDLTAKSPGDAAPVAARIAAKSPKFDKWLSHYAGEAFKEWMVADPSAADEWYRSALAAGDFIPTTIPPDGLGEQSIDRILARERLVGLLRSDPDSVKAMLENMYPDDITTAMRDISDPALVENMLRYFPPALKVSAASTAMRHLASTKGLGAAVEWAGTLGLEESRRDSLVALAVKDSSAARKIGLDEVADWAKRLAIPDAERSLLLVSAARDATFKDGKGWLWDEVGERCSWLRRELPAGQASQQVGEFIGSLAQYGLDSAVKQYERELERQPGADPKLTANFALRVAESGESRAIHQALKIIEAIPEGAERDDLRRAIEMKRK